MTPARQRSSRPKSNGAKPVLIRHFEASPSLPVPQPPIKTTKMISQTYGRAVGGFTLIAIIVAVLVMLMTGSRATVTITPAPITEQVGFDVLVQAQTSTTANNLSIPGRLLEMATSTSVTVTLSTSSAPNPNAKAVGMVTIRNRSNSPQALVATTRLLTTNNILFRLDNKVVVPANGQVKAAVTADQGGSAGAIDPTAFTIPGLNASRQKDIDAISTEKFQQATTTAAGLTDKDINQAKEQAVDQLTKRLTPSLTPYLFANEKIDDRAVTTTVITMTTTAKKGDKTNSLTFTGQVRISALLFNQDELQKKITEQILSGRSLNSVKIKDHSLTFTISRQVPNNSALGLIRGQLTLISSKINISPNNLTGRGLEDAKIYLQLLGGVQQADIKINPNWLKHLPHDPNRITIKILPLP